MSSNPAIKRLKKEYDEINADKDLPFTVHPIEDNFLEWHFTLRGPEDSDYSDGYYHGRIQFPADYPFSPPSLLFLTPNGRFQINTKICLSVTGFHPEQWQPAWGVRTMLIAIRNHFLVEDQGAVGYLAHSPADRRQQAHLSQTFTCAPCGYAPPKRTTQQTSEQDNTVPTEWQLSDEMRNILLHLLFYALLAAISYLIYVNNH